MKFIVELDGPSHLLIHTDDEFVNKQIAAAVRSITGLHYVAATNIGVQLATTNCHASQARAKLLGAFESDPYITANVA